MSENNLMMPRVPEGLRDLMKAYTKEVMRVKPQDLYGFSAEYFEMILCDKMNHPVRKYEPPQSYKLLIKNRVRQQVPLSFVYNIIPCNLTDLIKQFIKAVLKENPKNIYIFAVEYFQKLRFVKSEQTESIEYTAYEKFIEENEQSTFKKKLICECGRVLDTTGTTSSQSTKITTAHYIKSVYIIQRHFRKYLKKKVEKANEFASSHEETSKKMNTLETASASQDGLKPAQLYSVQYIKAAYIIQRYFRQYKEHKKQKRLKVSQSHTKEQMKAIYIIQRQIRRYLARKKTDENTVRVPRAIKEKEFSIQYMQAVCAIQRYFRRYLKRKREVKQQSGELDLVRDNISFTAAALVIQKAFRRIIKIRRSRRQNSGEKSLPKVDEEVNDNESEAASYTSASTVLLSTETVGEGGNEMGGISYEEGVVQETINEDEEVENDNINLPMEIFEQNGKSMIPNENVIKEDSIDVNIENSKLQHISLMDAPVKKNIASNEIKSKENLNSKLEQAIGAEDSASNINGISNVGAKNEIETKISELSRHKEETEPSLKSKTDSLTTADSESNHSAMDQDALASRNKAALKESAFKDDIEISSEEKQEVLNINENENITQGNDEIGSADFSRKSSRQDESNEMKSKENINNNLVQAIGSEDSASNINDISNVDAKNDIENKINEFSRNKDETEPSLKSTTDSIPNVDSESNHSAMDQDELASRNKAALKESAFKDDFEISSEEKQEVLNINENENITQGNDEIGSADFSRKSIRQDESNEMKSKENINNNLVQAIGSEDSASNINDISNVDAKNDIENKINEFSRNKDETEPSLKSTTDSIPNFDSESNHSAMDQDELATRNKAALKKSAFKDDIEISSEEKQEVLNINENENITQKNDEIGFPDVSRKSSPQDKSKITLLQHGSKGVVELTANEPNTIEFENNELEIDKKIDVKLEEVKDESELQDISLMDDPVKKNIAWNEMKLKENINSNLVQAIGSEDSASNNNDISNVDAKNDIENKINEFSRNKDETEPSLKSKTDGITNVDSESHHSAMDQDELATRKKAALKESAFKDDIEISSQEKQEVSNINENENITPGNDEIGSADVSRKSSRQDELNEMKSKENINSNLVQAIGSEDSASDISNVDAKNDIENKINEYSRNKDETESSLKSKTDSITNVDSESNHSAMDQDELATRNKAALKESAFKDDIEISSEEKEEVLNINENENITQKNDEIGFPDVSRKSIPQDKSKITLLEQGSQDVVELTANEPNTIEFENNELEIDKKIDAKLEELKGISEPIGCGSLEIREDDSNQKINSKSAQSKDRNMDEFPTSLDTEERMDDNDESGMEHKNLEKINEDEIKVGNASSALLKSVASLEDPNQTPIQDPCDVINSINSHKEKLENYIEPNGEGGISLDQSLDIEKVETVPEQSQDDKVDDDERQPITNKLDTVVVGKDEEHFAAENSGEILKDEYTTDINDKINDKQSLEKGMKKSQDSLSNYKLNILESNTGMETEPNEVDSSNIVSSNKLISTLDEALEKPETIVSKIIGANENGADEVEPQIKLETKITKANLGENEQKTMDDESGEFLKKEENSKLNAENLSSTSFYSKVEDNIEQEDDIKLTKVIVDPIMVGDPNKVVSSSIDKNKDLPNLETSEEIANEINASTVHENHEADGQAKSEILELETIYKADDETKLIEEKSEKLLKDDSTTNNNIIFNETSKSKIKSSPKNLEQTVEDSTVSAKKSKDLKVNVIETTLLNEEAKANLEGIATDQPRGTDENAIPGLTQKLQLSNEMKEQMKENVSSDRIHIDEEKQIGGLSNENLELGLPNKSQKMAENDALIADNTNPSGSLSLKKPNNFSSETQAHLIDNKDKKNISLTDIGKSVKSTNEAELDSMTDQENTSKSDIRLKRELTKKEDNKNLSKESNSDLKLQGNHEINSSETENNNGVDITDATGDDQDGFAAGPSKEKSRMQSIGKQNLASATNEIENTNKEKLDSNSKDRKFTISNSNRFMPTPIAELQLKSFRHLADAGPWYEAYIEPEEPKTVPNQKISKEIQVEIEKEQNKSINVVYAEPKERPITAGQSSSKEVQVELSSEPNSLISVSEPQVSDLVTHQRISKEIQVEITNGEDNLVYVATQNTSSSDISAIQIPEKQSSSNEPLNRRDSISFFIPLDNENNGKKGMKPKKLLSTQRSVNKKLGKKAKERDDQLKPNLPSPEESESNQEEDTEEINVANFASNPDYRDRSTTKLQTIPELKESESNSDLMLEMMNAYGDINIWENDASDDETTITETGEVTDRKNWKLESHLQLFEESETSGELESPELLENIPSPPSFYFENTDVEDDHDEETQKKNEDLDLNIAAAKIQKAVRNFLKVKSQKRAALSKPIRESVNTDVENYVVNYENQRKNDDTDLNTAAAKIQKAVRNFLKAKSYKRAALSKPVRESANTDVETDIENDKNQRKNDDIYLNEAASKIQKAVRNFLKVKSQKTAYLSNPIIESAVIKIQRAYRTFAEEKKLRETGAPIFVQIDSHENQTHKWSEQMAAYIIANAYKKYLLRKKSANAESNLNDSPASIQGTESFQSEETDATKSEWFVGTTRIIPTQQSKNSAVGDSKETINPVELVADNSNDLLDTKSTIGNYNNDKITEISDFKYSNLISNNLAGAIKTEEVGSVEDAQLAIFIKPDSMTGHSETAAVDEFLRKEIEFSILHEPHLNSIEPLIIKESVSLTELRNEDEEGQMITQNNADAEVDQKSNIEQSSESESAKSPTENVSAEKNRKLSEQGPIRRSSDAGGSLTEDVDEADGDIIVHKGIKRQDTRQSSGQSDSVKFSEFEPPKSASENVLSSSSENVQQLSENAPTRHLSQARKGPAEDVEEGDGDIIVRKGLKREDTRESSGQSDSVIYGYADNNQPIVEVEKSNDAIAKAQLLRHYTIAGDDPRGLFDSASSSPTPGSELIDGVASDSFCLDDETSEMIRKKMMAYSLSEADSELLDPSRVVKDDFHVDTALGDTMGTSTETESTIVSAATKIQAGARGFLTRRRLHRASAGTKSSTQDTKASFGNEAISESLERFIEEEAARKIQNAYRTHYENKKRNENIEMFNLGTSLAARRQTLQRGDALHNDSTPDDDNSGSINDQPSKIAGQKLATGVISTSVSLTPRPNPARKFKMATLRQHSMPVQIDCEVIRVIPRKIRKRIKSAETAKKMRN